LVLIIFNGFKLAFREPDFGSQLYTINNLKKVYYCIISVFLI